MNHLPKSIKVDYTFFSNQRRFNQYSKDIDNTKVIVTSNINKESSQIYPFTIDYEKIIKQNNLMSDNVSMLFINKLVNDHYKEVFIAGLDGYTFNNENYSYNENYKNNDKMNLESQNKSISDSLLILREKINIKLITSSIFK